MEVFDTHWRIIAETIASLTKALEFANGAILGSGSSEDPYGIVKSLAPLCRQLLAQIKAFKNFPNQDPTLVATLKEFLEKKEPLIEERVAKEKLRAFVVAAFVLDNQVRALIAQNHRYLIPRTERAFKHLQRSLCVSETFRKDWSNAFEKGEEACERLGGLHLLSHGVFAFKAHGTAARTDLVFQDEVREDDPNSTGTGLVLTEWKVGNEKDAVNKFQAARRQLNDYQDGVLGAAQLRNVRFIILVSENYLPSTMVPKDSIDRQVLYRHINIAVNPSSPSKRPY